MQTTALSMSVHMRTVRDVQELTRHDIFNTCGKCRHCLVFILCYTVGLNRAVPIGTWPAELPGSEQG